MKHRYLDVVSSTYGIPSTPSHTYPTYPVIRVLNTASPELLPACAELYCAIWREPPWNETFWTVQRVTDDMKAQLSKAGSICYIAVNATSDPVGFTWGYRMTLLELVALIGDKRIQNYISGNAIFYIDELGVDSSHRGFGIGQEITRRIIDEAHANGAKYCALRTDVQAVPARSLYAKLGFQELPLVDQHYPSRTYWLLHL